jgi:hypothetical protein
MEDNSTIFNADKATPSDTTSQTASTQAEQVLIASLVGEGKKYKNTEDLAKAYVSADSFIEQLKTENRELREKTVANKTIDDVLERLQQQQSATPVDRSDVSVTDITKLVEQTVTGMETQKVKTANLLKADQKMKQMFGEKAGDKFEQVAVTPQLKQIYMELAAVDPDKFVSLFVEGGSKGTGVDAGGSVNTTVNHSSGNSVRTNTIGAKEYYDNVRKTNPTQYYSQVFQLNMDKQVRSNPTLYYGR